MTIAQDLCISCKNIHLHWLIGQYTRFIDCLIFDRNRYMSQLSCTIFSALSFTEFDTETSPL